MSFWTRKTAKCETIEAQPSCGHRPMKRRFPIFPRWAGIAEFTITDDGITKEQFELAVRAAGRIVGIGRFRPQNGGSYGRFRVTKFEWTD